MIFRYSTYIHIPVKRAFLYLRGYVRVLEVNNNPFEYWLAHDDPSYVNLMVAVEACLSSPGPCDRPVSELLTGEMFKELKVALNVDGMLDEKQVLRGGVPYAWAWPI